MSKTATVKKSQKITKKTIERAFQLMCYASEMALTYDENRKICEYVHSTSRGHEAVQLAVGFQILPQDYVFPYYRDEAMMLGMGFSPYHMMLQLLAKGDDPFSGGRSYYGHPSFRHPDFPTIPHQSSATGMQVIPATGAAQGLKYLIGQDLYKGGANPISVCSLGDSSVTEGEVSEAFQFAVLHQLPVLYLVQDNEWGISVSADEARTMDAYEYAAGFKGMERMTVDGSDFITLLPSVQKAVDIVRFERKPMLLHVKVPLLGHHTSGVRKEWYRSEEDLADHFSRDPFPILKQRMLEGVGSFQWTEKQLATIENKATEFITSCFDDAKNAPPPNMESIQDHEFALSPITEEQGIREPEGNEPVIMVDAALHAMNDILKTHPEALFYGQDVGGRLGGVFREAATLAQKYGDSRIFNTAIQEAYIVGSTAGMSATGCKPMVEIQFADYIWPAVNQLVTELSKSCFLTMGKFPISSVIRIPIGAYGGGGPYHSGTIESAILRIKGIKVVYPSNAADIKGLLKGAYYDPNPVIMFEHKGLYWSKVPGTNAAKTIDPSDDYIIPLGQGRIDTEASSEALENGDSLLVVTYGMGVHWSKNAAKKLGDRVEILDLRTLYPLDTDLIYERVRIHNKVLIVTEEPISNSFAQTLAGRISEFCFTDLDAPVKVIGALDNPAVPLNKELEKVMLPNAEKVQDAMAELLAY